MKRPLLLTLLLAGLPFLALLYWVAVPPLAVEHGADGVTVHVERLGEYNSALTEFVIFDGETHAEVVRLIPRQDTISMWTLHLRAGNNELDPSALAKDSKDSDYIVQTPAGGAAAHLTKGHLYEVAVKGFSMFGTEFLPIRLCRNVAFVL
jgi:hypothetical protein